MSLKYEPSSEPLHISAKWLFLNCPRYCRTQRRRSLARCLSHSHAISLPLGPLSLAHTVFLFPSGAHKKLSLWLLAASLIARQSRFTPHKRFAAHVLNRGVYLSRALTLPFSLPLSRSRSLSLSLSLSLSVSLACGGQPAASVRGVVRGCFTV